MKFNIIACINQVLCLGKGYDLMYHISNDLKNFKSITLGGVIIMGKKTYDSLPKKPLSHRVNIVITSDKDFNPKDCIVVHSIEECIELCERMYHNVPCYVIGGASIYQQFIDRELVDTMYITEVIDTTEGDVYFPNVLMDTDKWRIFYRSDTQHDRINKLTYFFTIYKENNVKID